MSSNPTFAPPVTFGPAPGPTTNTLIFLHGRGDSSKNFAFFFNSAITSSSLDLEGVLTPTTRIVLPTCNPILSPTYRTNFTQWFDIYHEKSALSAGGRDNGTYSEHQLQSLRECVEYIHSLIQAEIDAGVKESNIWVGGISQGMAAAFAAVMAGNWRLAGLIGMSGWMPFCGDVTNDARAMAGYETLDLDWELLKMPVKPVEDEDDTVLEYGLPIEKRVEVLKNLRRNIGIPELEAAEEVEAVKRVLDIPVFLGHGDVDQTVRYQIGRSVLKALRGVGMEVVWKRYEGLGHWWQAPQEIDDMVTFMVKGGLELGHGEEVKSWFGTVRKREEVVERET